MLLTSDQFSNHEHYLGLTSGRHVISYSDSTHTQKDEWLNILEVDVQQPPHGRIFDEAERFYQVRHLVDTIPAKKTDPTQLKDLLGLSLTRLGLLEPELPGDLFEQVRSLHDESGIVLIPDSNSLYNGSLHWLLHVLRKSTVWILPFVVSLTQIQERDARLKGMVNKHKQDNARQALRLRATINASLGLLQRHKSRYQVLELDPTLLRYLRMTSSADGEGNILEDRLLIEGVHAVLRATRTRAKQLVVTSDVLMARVLEAEGINHLYLPSPKIVDDPIRCVRYNALAQTFSGAPLRLLLWDLAHCLASVRLVRQDDGSGFTLSAYWPGKTPEDWRRERLGVEFYQGSFGGGPKAGAPDKHESDPTSRGGQSVSEVSSSSAVETPTEEGGRASADQRHRTIAEIGGRAKARLDRHKTAKSPASGDAYLPRASLVQVLRVGGALRRLRQANLSSVVANIGEADRPTPEIARRALQILERVGAALHEGSEYLATSILDLMNEHLSNENLDALSQLFLRFPPYALVQNVLHDRGDLERSQIEPLLREAAKGDLNTDAAARFPRFHVLLGQAWTDGEVTVDGSSRPDDATFEAAFRAAFGQLHRDGLAKVSELLPALCSSLRMSPWAAGRRIEDLVISGRLVRFAFQPAAGRKPIVRDKVVSGELDSVTEVAVPVDRLLIAGRPIFTVAGDTR
jgi:hypothetical protein